MYKIHIGNYLPILCCVILFGLSGCKAKKGLEETEKPLSQAEQVKRQLVRQQVRADWLDGKARISFDDGSFSQSATANIRIQKDSAIWLSVRKLGFEVARALVTTDSVFLVDRFNQAYAAEDLTFLSKSYNLPASLQSLQALLFGNPVFLAVDSLSITNNATDVELIGQRGTRSTKYKLQPIDYRLLKMTFEDSAAAQTLEADLLEYKELPDGQNFSYIRKINVQSPDTGNVSIGLEFSKVEINVPINFRFEIPKHYTKME